MLNLKHVLDNSKMMNMLTNSPRKETADPEADNSFTKYEAVTLNIPEVSE
jgi:hypothetical protein